MKRALLSLPFLFSIALVVGCEVDTVPFGLRRTPAGDGPLIKFEPDHRPLPEVPLPNDVATFADPTSRTGRRINVSLAAPTHMEQVARDDFSSMEGWGVSSPITVSFQRPDSVDPREAAIDIDAVAEHMGNDEHDPSNDPFYVVNLGTGIPMFVDVESGYFPVVVRDPFRYFPNDPKAGESNLSFETTEEGKGLPQSAYRPELDRDFDGVLDHPNTRRRASRGPNAITGVDDLLTWYERETDTLILRPILPLEEKTEYAVVLTDRLRDVNGKAVRSPFEAIHHPSQVAGVTRLKDWLTDKRLANYYGDIAGTGLDHVAFTWTFTTQPTHEDMRILRDGLYGKGPFARWKDEYPPNLTVGRIGGVAPANEDQPAGWETSSEACKLRAKTPFVLKVNDPDIRASLRQIFEQVFGLDKGGLKAVDSTFDYIDHIVIGTFKTPYLLGDPASRDPDTRFHLDFKTGKGDVHTDEVQWILVVPKSSGERKEPFPVSFWGHGVTGHADEVLLYGGDYARQGIALIAYNEPGHGLVLSEGDSRVANAALIPNCLQPFISGVTGGRAHDINGDGIGDSGWYWWTSHVFHTRDNVRQGILDGMQLTRILRAFDGRVGTQDLNGDGNPEIAGDFDGNGVIDVGGPNVPYFSAGESLGGIMSDVQGGIEPHMIAAAPMSGGGMLAMDVAVRSYGVAESVTSQLMGPFVFAIPASERPNRGEEKEKRDEMGSKCGATQRTVRLLVNEGINNQEIEVACLDPAELSQNMTIVVSNVTSGEVRCARTEIDGRFRIPIPTSRNDKLDIQVYTAPDVVSSYDGCRIKRESPAGRRIKTFEQSAIKTWPVANPERDKCDVAEGCQQFRDSFYAVGASLTAPNEGLGLRRQSPSFRRFRDLAQAAFDPADPIVFAPYYMLKPLFDENGTRVPSHALLTINTIGDNFVQVSSHLSFARAAGALPFLPPNAHERFPEYADYATPGELYDRLGRRTPMQFLVDTRVAEGIPRLRRASAGPACKPNYRPDPQTCTEKVSIDKIDCINALYDPDWVSEGQLPYDQQHPDVPLRLARVAKVRVTDSTSLAASWEPRLRGVPFGPDDAGWTASERVVGLFEQYLVPEGAHTWSVGDACRAWDFATYGNALTARFFASGGRDIYYLSHPKTHGCLVNGTCDFLLK